MCCISRKGRLHYCKPDFSKVEPKVRFPKGGYKPPKSRRSAKRGSLSPEPPVVFKSPADIVKEVLLNITDRSPAPSDSNEPPGSAPDFIVPQEFRSHQHATTLIEQLQVQSVQASIPTPLTQSWKHSTVWNIIVPGSFKIVFHLNSGAKIIKKSHRVHTYTGLWIRPISALCLSFSLFLYTPFLLLPSSDFFISSPLTAGEVQHAADQTCRSREHHWSSASGSQGN